MSYRVQSVCDEGGLVMGETLNHQNSTLKLSHSVRDGDRQTDRQTERQTDRQRERETDRQSDRQRDKETGINFNTTAELKFAGADYGVCYKTKKRLVKTVEPLQLSVFCCT